MPLAEADPEVYALIQKERKRQFEGLELIASEVRSVFFPLFFEIVFVEFCVTPCVGMSGLLHDKQIFRRISWGTVCCYHELFGSRFSYYGGNQVIDESERLCQKRALAAFHLDPSKWGVNVQPLSGMSFIDLHFTTIFAGSPANFAVYHALLKPHDRLMGLDLPHGGQSVFFCGMVC